MIQFIVLHKQPFPFFGKELDHILIFINDIIFLNNRTFIKKIVKWIPVFTLYSLSDLGCTLKPTVSLYGITDVNSFISVVLVYTGGTSS